MSQISVGPGGSRRTARRLAPWVAAAALAGLAGCGGDSEPVGWVDGSPAAADSAARAGAPGAGTAERGGGVAYDLASAPAGGGPGKPGTAKVASDAAKPGTIGVPPEAPEAPATKPLRAGSVDDNVTFAAFLRYRTDFLATAIEAHDRDVTGRVVAAVVTPAGAPVLGARVTLTDASGTTLSEARTDITGTAVLFPAPQPTPPDGQGQQQSSPAAVSIRAELGDANATATVADAAALQRLTLEAPAAAPTGLDVLFLIDATGSMGDEIARLRETMASVARRVSETPSAPPMRFGLTVFRDRGDAFVTRTFDFTNDVAAVEEALSEVVADGGGDTPEAVNEALHAALAKPSWSTDPSAVKLVFLVGDAAPHLDYDDDPDYVADALDAARRGITIHPVASSGLDEQGEYVFRQLALLTGGRFSFLTYGAGGTEPGDETPHTVGGYEALSLDDLVVRLVREEIGAKP